MGLISTTPLFLPATHLRLLTEIASAVIPAETISWD
jgi:hypothetical protein